MSISILKAFDDVFSTRYNIQNLIGYIIIVLIQLFCQNRQKIDLENMPLNLIIFYFCALIILSILFSGYNAIINNNICKGQNDAVPSLENIGFILINGSKIYFASIIYGLLAGILTCIPAVLFILLLLNSENKIIIILFLVITEIIIICGIFLFLIPLILMFYENLEIESLFAVDKIANFYKDRKGNFTFYCISGFLSGIIFVSVIMIFSLLSYKFKFNDVLINIFIAILSVFSTLLFANINAQFINSKRK